MKVVMVNYADRAYKKSQKENTKTALEHGVDEVIEYGFKDLPDEFKKKHANMFKSQRGAGYWIWKSKIVEMVLS